MNTTIIPNRTLFILKPTKKLSLWLLNASKKILPKFLQTSDKKILIIWLILLLIASIVFSLLIYFLYSQQRKKGNYQINSSPQHRFVRFDRNSQEYRTIFNLKFNCKNHKCLCQYRRNTHSSLYLTKSKSIVLSNLELNSTIQPLLIQPTELRYAKIKRISSTKDLDNPNYLTGQFRTIVKLKSLPN